jgi:Flp pilus assembly pilin Flp
MNNLKAKLLDETGAATAEYAIATMAAVGFAGLLVVSMRSDEVRTIVFDLVKSALTFSSPNAEVAPQ